MAPLLFDLDGTLIDSLADIEAAAHAAFAAEGFPPLPHALIRGLVGDGLGQFLVGALRHVAPELAPAEVDAAVPRLLQRYRAHYLEHGVAATQAYPGACALVHELHALGVPLAVVSNKSEPAVRAVIEQLGLTACFGALVGGDTLPVRKPDPAPLHHALALLHPGTPAPPRAVMIGDGHQDVLAGRAAGVRTIWVAWGFGHLPAIDAAKPDERVSTMAELRAVLLATA